MKHDFRNARRNELVVSWVDYLGSFPPSKGEVPAVRRI